ncbi:hypothetical protein GmHk_14G041034 [Glycine max]|nr:hypothetical protein GmHk_14G041034 [Glycine max]
MLPFDFRCVTETYGLCINIFWFSGMSWNFTNCLMMGAKHLTRTKERSHVIKQRSPDEIRV